MLISLRSKPFSTAMSPDGAVSMRANSSLCVLIADDCADDRGEVRRSLLIGSDIRYHFQEAQTAKEVFALCQAHGWPDCLILDHNLPDMNGTEFLSEVVGIHGITPCPVVILTGSMDRELGKQIVRMGAHDFLGKNWATPESLTRSIENAMERFAMANELHQKELALQRSNERLQLLRDFAELLIAGNDQVNGFDRLLSRVCKCLRVQALIDLTLDSREGEGTRLRLANAIGLPMQLAALLSHQEFERWLSEDGPCGFKLQDQFGSVSAELIRCDIHWLLAIPLVSSKQRQGALILAAREAFDFDEGELEFVKSLSHHFSVSKERSHREVLLRRSESFSRSLIESSPDCVKVLDLDGRLQWINAKGQRLLEICDFSTVNGLLWSTFWHGEQERENCECALAEARNGRVGRFQSECCTATGTARAWDVAVTSIPGIDGEPERLLAISRDVTEQQYVMQQLSARQRELQTLADNTPDILSRFDRRLRHLFVNSAVERITGRPASEFIGKTNRELGMPTQHCNLWDAALAGVFRTGEPTSIDFSFASEIGLRFFSARLVPEFAGDGRVECVLVVTTDITDRKHMEEKLKLQDLRKDHFLATLAHELRNPLAPIRSGIQFLAMSDQWAGDAKATLEIMDRQLGHMVHLVDDLLDVSRISSGKIVLRREVVDLRSIVRTALETSRPLIENADHQLVYSEPGSEIWIDGDPSRISQVVCNLINNAAKYTPPGGQIKCELFPQGAESVIRVQDNGTGIPPEMLSEIFEMFTQVNGNLDRSQGGLGIGLSLVRRLVELHGGSVDVASPGVGQGSTFNVYLPMCEPTSAAGRGDEVLKKEKVSLRGRRVMIVDDNTDAARILALVLECNGHRTLVVHSGAAALQIAREFDPEVVLLDIGMPAMNGYEVAKRMRSELALQRTVLVAVTGWGSEEDKNSAHEAGFDFHLTKPIETSSLNRILAKIEAGRAAQAG